MDELDQDYITRLNQLKQKKTSSLFQDDSLLDDYAQQKSQNSQKNKHVSFNQNNPLNETTDVVKNTIAKNIPRQPKNLKQYNFENNVGFQQNKQLRQDVETQLNLQQQKYNSKGHLINQNKFQRKTNKDELNTDLVKQYYNLAHNKLKVQQNKNENNKQQYLNEQQSNVDFKQFSGLQESTFNDIIPDQQHVQSPTPPIQRVTQHQTKNQNIPTIQNQIQSNSRASSVQIIKQTAKNHIKKQITKQIVQIDTNQQNLLTTVKFQIDKKLSLQQLVRFKKQKILEHNIQLKAIGQLMQIIKNQYLNQFNQLLQQIENEVDQRKIDMITKKQTFVALKMTLKLNKLKNQLIQANQQQYCNLNLLIIYRRMQQKSQIANFQNKSSKGQNNLLRKYFNIIQRICQYYQSDYLVAEQLAKNREKSQIINYLMLIKTRKQLLIHFESKQIFYRQQFWFGMLHNEFKQTKNQIIFTKLTNSIFNSQNKQHIKNQQNNKYQNLQLQLTHCKLKYTIFKKKYYSYFVKQPFIEFIVQQLKQSNTELNNNQQDTTFLLDAQQENFPQLFGFDVNKLNVQQYIQQNNNPNQQNTSLLKTNQLSITTNSRLNIFKTPNIPMVYNHKNDIQINDVNKFLQQQQTTSILKTSQVYKQQRQNISFTEFYNSQINAIKQSIDQNQYQKTDLLNFAANKTKLLIFQKEYFNYYKLLNIIGRLYYLHQISLDNIQNEQLKQFVNQQKFDLNKLNKQFQQFLAKQDNATLIDVLANVYLSFRAFTVFKFLFYKNQYFTLIENQEQFKLQQFSYNQFKLGIKSQQDAEERIYVQFYCRLLKRVAYCNVIKLYYQDFSQKQIEKSDNIFKLVIIRRQVIAWKQLVKQQKFKYQQINSLLRNLKLAIYIRPAFRMWNGLTNILTNIYQSEQVIKRNCENRLIQKLFKQWHGKQKLRHLMHKILNNASQQYQIQHQYFDIPINSHSNLTKFSFDIFQLLKQQKYERSSVFNITQYYNLKLQQKTFKQIYIVCFQQQLADQYNQQQTLVKSKNVLQALCQKVNQLYQKSTSIQRQHESQVKQFIQKQLIYNFRAFKFNTFQTKKSCFNHLMKQQKINLQVNQLYNLKLSQKTFRQLIVSYNYEQLINQHTLKQNKITMQKFFSIFYVQYLLKQQQYQQKMQDYNQVANLFYLNHLQDWAESRIQFLFSEQLLENQQFIEEVCKQQQLCSIENLKNYQQLYNINVKSRLFKIWRVLYQNKVNNKMEWGDD